MTPISHTELQALQAAYGPKAWAHLLQLRHQRGHSLNRNQVRCYRNALHLNVPAV